MLNKLLATTSKGVLVSIILGVGVLLIVLADPPHDVCDTQIEIFEKSQTGSIFKDEEKEYVEDLDLKKAGTECKFGNSPGSCYKLFQYIKYLKVDLDKIPQDCTTKVGSIKEVKEALFGNMELILLLAWGKAAPATYFEKFSWLNKADMSLFCQLKDLIIEFYGKQGFETWREEQLLSLPGADKLSREKVWEASLLSVNCDSYPR